MPNGSNTHRYNSYKDVRGKDAKDIATAMGVDGGLGSTTNSFSLIEVREAADHVRLSAHANKKFTEVLIFNDRSLEVIRIDTVANRALKTLYDAKGGSVTTLQADWSQAGNGYQSSYEEISKLTGAQNIVDAEWEKFDTLLMQAEIKLGGGPEGMR